MEIFSPINNHVLEIFIFSNHVFLQNNVFILFMNIINTILLVVIIQDMILIVSFILNYCKQYEIFVRI